MRTVEIEAAAAVAVASLERMAQIKFASPEGEALREAMRATWEMPTPEEAKRLLQWVEPLVRDLVGVAQAGGLLPPDDPSEGAVLIP